MDESVECSKCGTTFTYTDLDTTDLLVCAACMAEIPNPAKVKDGEPSYLKDSGLGNRWIGDSRNSVDVNDGRNWSTGVAPNPHIHYSPAVIEEPTNPKDMMHKLLASADVNEIATEYIDSQVWDKKTKRLGKVVVAQFVAMLGALIVYLLTR